MRAVGAVLLLTGCNAILGLDPTHARGDGGADASADGGPRADGGACAIGHDEDGDQIDDGCDLCPQIPGDPQIDSDGDGIGDACDPNPADPHDVLLFFDSFAVPNGWAGLRGTWSAKEDAFWQADDAIGSSLAGRALPDPNADDLTLDVVFTIDARQPVQTGEVVANRGIGVWFVASGFSDATDPSGYLCQVYEDIASTLPASSLSLYTVDQTTSSATVLQTRLFDQHTAEGVPGRLRVHHGPPTLPDPEACHVELGAITGDVVGEDLKLESGTIGLRTLQTAVHFTSVTAYGRKP